MIVPPLECTFGPFLTAAVISLALQLNYELVVEMEMEPCFKIKSEVPVALYLDCVAVGMACAFSDDTSCSKLPKAYTTALWAQAKIKYKCWNTQDLFQSMYWRRK